MWLNRHKQQLGNQTVQRMQCITELEGERTEILEERRKHRVTAAGAQDTYKSAISGASEKYKNLCADFSAVLADFNAGDQKVLCYSAMKDFENAASYTFCLSSDY